nr:MULTISPECIES: DUF3088 family protein [unclassified Pseudodesulfovibrio]
MEGRLSYYPEVRGMIDVVKVDFPRPCPAIIEILGKENQACHCLIPADSGKACGLPVRTYGATSFIDDHKGIIEYPARNHGVGRPAHD